MCKPNYFGNPQVGCRRECNVMVDCPIDKYCDENYRCRDPCIGASCAYNALCTAINHQAICVCPESSTGDPYDECVAITKSKNTGVFGGAIHVPWWNGRFVCRAFGPSENTYLPIFVRISGVWNDLMLLLISFVAQYFATCYACIGFQKHEQYWGSYWTNIIF